MLAWIVPTKSPTWPEVISGAIDSRLNNVFTAMPGRVESFDPTTQRAAIQPLVMGAYRDEADVRLVERMPIVADVPVVFPGAGPYRLTFPVVPGSTVLLIFTSSSLDKWLAVGGEVDPGDDRRNTISDAIAIPGLYSFGGTTGPGTPTAPNDAMVLWCKAGETIKLGGDDADDPIVRKSDLQAFISNTFAGHTHNPGTFVAPSGGGAVTGASAGAAGATAPACSPVVRSK